MNAYEIADELDGRLDHKAANMLRQQADRIAELEDRLSMYEIKDLDRGIIARTKDYAIHDLVHRTTPQIKELTNEEIRQIAVECGAYINEDTGSLYPDDMCVGSFARAILKKASEK